MIQDKKQNPQIHSLLLKDLDKAVISWFENDHPLIIDGRKTPVMYVSKERWAQIYKDKGIKDERGQIILPVISVRRLNPEHKKERYAPIDDATDITFYRRVASQPYNAKEGINLNDYQQGTPDIKYLNAKDKPVFEILKIPFPSIVDIDYDIVLWTNYVNHQNMSLENVLTEFGGGKNYFKINDYNFFVKLKNTQDQSNLEDFTGKERILKTRYTLEVQAYLIDKTKVKISRTITNTRFKFTEQ